MSDLMDWFESVDPDVIPMSIPCPANHWRRKRIPLAEPPTRTPESPSTVNHSPANGIVEIVDLFWYEVLLSGNGYSVKVLCMSFFVIAPPLHNAVRHGDAPAPLSILQSPPKKSYAPSPSMPWSKHHRGRNKTTGPAPASSYHILPPSPMHQGS